MPNQRTGELVGLKEIADRLQVKPKTPQQWLQRGLLPDPVNRIGGRPIYDWGDIEAWASRTGRLP